jgi:hypothetical protein
MISKNSFVKIMNALRDYWDELSADMDRLGVVFENNHLTRIFDKTMDALCEDLEGDLPVDPEAGPWCCYFAFELDWGRRDMAMDCVEIDGVKYALRTPEQLYDLLVLLNERENTYE